MRRQRQRPSVLAAVLVLLVAFAWIALAVTTGAAVAFDRALLLALHQLAGPGLDQAMVMASRVGSGRLMLPVDIVIGALLLARRRAGDALFWATAVGGASLLDFVAKRMFERTRPDLWVSIAPEATFSFPSGHAMQTMAPVLAAALLSWPTPWRWPVLVVGAAFVLIVGTSRMYLGVHFPTDVLGGWLAAAAWVTLSSVVTRRHPGAQWSRHEPPEP